jgi:hypothetical protein
MCRQQLRAYEDSAQAEVDSLFVEPAAPVTPAKPVTRFKKPSIAFTAPTAMELKKSSAPPPVVELKSTPSIYSGNGWNAVQPGDSSSGEEPELAIPTAEPTTKPTKEKNLRSIDRMNAKAEVVEMQAAETLRTLLSRGEMDVVMMKEEQEEVVKLLREEGSHATNLTFGHNNTSRSN